MNTVLVVDDKEMMRDSVGSTLQRAGFRVVTAESGESAVEQIARKRPDAVVTDLKMPGMGGLGLLEKIREIDDELPVVLMTAFGAIDTAVKAIKLGAFDYINKPFEGDELVISVKRAIRHAGLVRENAVLRASECEAPAAPGKKSDGRFGLERIIGESAAIRRVKEQVSAVAESHSTVLVVGESGAGKEVIARAIHDLSPRRDAPFLAVNCAALSESLLESELFGHERGAFTGAEGLRKGRFELADGGTLLLDEVSEVGPKIQAKLLRVLQEREFERVGSSVTIGVDVRVIATSNRDLPRAVAAGQFRGDLFFRLNVLPVHLPPLRDRPEDVPMLAEHFLEGIRKREGRPQVMFDDDALDLLCAYGWPGNVRELQNICERAVVLSGCEPGGRSGAVIRRAMIEPWLAPPAVEQSAFGFAEEAPAHAGPVAFGVNGNGSNGTHLAPTVVRETEDRSLSFPSDATMKDIERWVIVRTLERFNGHRKKTAESLGIGVRTLGLKLKQWKEEELVSPTL